MPTPLETVRDRAIAAGYAAELIAGRPEMDIGPRVVFRRPSDDDDPTPYVVVAEEAAHAVLDSRFDEFQPLDDFEAIWSRAAGIIECGLDSGNARLGPFYTLETLARRLGIIDLRPFPAGDGEIAIPIPPPRHDLSIQLRAGSLEYVILRPLFGRRLVFRPERMPRLPVIRIEGYHARSAEDASDFLERVGNAVLFQLDLKTGVPVFLSRPVPSALGRSVRPTDAQPKLRAPEFEYDREPMALYWYARTAFQMPLLQFLAFYQVAEYYFPAFSEVKARENIQRLLKDPRFDPSSARDLNRLMNHVRVNRSGRGYGDEKSQLQATIQECISPQELREFFESDERRRRFYDRPSGKKMPLVSARIPIGAKDADLRPSVAERLYAIRCRIVHTKASDDVSEQILLPFSREAALLRFDNELMEFVARQILIATSRPLRLG